MNTRLRWLAVAFLIPAPLLVDCGCASRPAPVPIKIGHLSLENSAAERAAAEQARRGIDLAVEEANQKDPVLKRPVVVYHPEASKDPTELPAQAVRLITINKVVALLADGSAATSKELPGIAQTYTTPLLLPAGLPDHTAGDYVFYTGATPRATGRSLARLAAERWKPTPIVLQAADNPFAAAVADAFVEEFRKKSGKPLEGPKVYKTASELTGLLAAATQEQRVLLLAAGAKDIAEAARSKVGKQTILLWGAADADASVLQAARPDVNVYLVTPFPPIGGGGEAAAFASRFQERFGQAPDIHAALAYDDARILFGAIRRAERTDGAALQKALLGLKDFPILTGTLSFREDGVAARPLFIVRVHGGQTETTPASGD